MSRFNLALLAGVVIAVVGWIGSPVDAQITPGVDFNVDANLDTDGDRRWEDTVAGNPSGFDFRLDNSPAVNRQTGVSSLPGISAAYNFPGGSTGNEAGAELTNAGSGTTRSFKNAGWNTQDVTIELWFKPDELAPGPDNGQILFEDGGGRGFGFFVDDSLIRLRGMPDAVEVNSDISTISGEFIQAVGTFDVSTGDIELFVNGVSAGTDSTGNEADWTGGDPAAVGTRGGANTGGIGSGQSDTESFNGKIAIFRLYNNQILTPDQVARNFHEIATTDMFFDNNGGAGDSTWDTNANWAPDPGLQPSANQNAYVGGGLTANVTQAGEVAKNLIVGHNQATAPGNGTLSINSGDLTTGDLTLGQGATVGTVTIAGGTLTVGGDTSTPGTGTINLNSGTLELLGNATTRQVTTYNHAGGATLRLGIHGTPGGVTPLNVTGTATMASSGSSLVDVQLFGDPGSPTVTWDGGTGDWDVNANWNPDVIPALGAGAVLSGQKIAFLTAGSLVNSGNVAATDAANWQVNVVGGGNGLEIERTGPTTGTGPAKAVIDTAAANVTRTTNLRIAPENGADAAELQVDNGTLTIAGGNELILGGGADGTVTQNGGTVHVTGNLRFGPTNNDEGGVYNLNAGTLDVDQAIVETNSGVDSAQLHVNGGTLDVAGNITVQRFSIGEAASSSGAAYTIPSGKTVHSRGTTVVGSQGTGASLTVNDTLIADGSSFVAEKTGSSGTMTINSTGSATFNAATFAIANANNTTGNMGIVGGSFTAKDLNLASGNNSTANVMMNGGSFTADVVSLANGSNSNAVIDSQGGTLAVTDLQLATVNNSTANVTLDGGSLTSTGGIDLAPHAGGTATMTLKNGAIINNSGGNFETALNGTGTVVMEGGTLNQTTNNLIVGQNANSDATFEMRGGALNVSAGGGTIRVGNKLNATGKFLLYGGTVTVDRDMDTFGNESGTNTTGSALIVVDDTHANSNAPAVLNVGRNLDLGQDPVTGGTTQMDLNSGTVTVDGNLLLSQGDGNTATFNLAGGKLDMTGGDVVIGNAHDQFNFTGGRLENMATFRAGRPLVFDESGNDQHGSTVNMDATHHVLGKLGMAVDFDNAVLADLDDRYITFGDIAEMDNGSDGTFSVAMWFKRETDHTGGHTGSPNSARPASNHNVNNVLIAQSSDSDNDNFELGTEGNDVEIYIDAQGSNDISGDGPTIGGSGIGTDWHHIVFTYDKGRTDEVEVWFDGSLASFGNSSAPDGDLAGSAGSPLTLGIARGGSDNWGDFDGQIDDFSFWTRALASTEIGELYGDGATTMKRADELSTLNPGDLEIYTSFDDTLVFSQLGGVLAPGASSGTSRIVSHYEQGVGAIYEVEIAGLLGPGDPDGNDFVDVAQTASLDGILEVVLLGGFNPLQGETFEVLTALDIMIGSNFELNDPTGYWLWDVIPGRNGEVLVLTAIVPEPATLVIWSLLAGLGIGLGWRRRKR